MRAASCATPEWANRQFTRPAKARAVLSETSRAPLGHQVVATIDGPDARERRNTRSEAPGSRRMKPPIRLVVLDMAGTTVDDGGAVEEAFQRALDEVGLAAGNLAGDPADYIRRSMGQSKISVFSELLGGDHHRAEQ